MYAQVEKSKENKSTAIANSVAQQKSKGKQGFRFVDNRPEAITQRKLQTLRNYHSHSLPIQKKDNIDYPPIQRRVALALDDKDTEDDIVILTNLDYALSYAGGPTVDLGTNADFSGMSEGEDLMILEHGSPGKIQEKFDAKTITQKLIGTPSTAIPDNIGHIILLSCYAGVAQEGQSENSALVNGIASLLSKNGYNLPVFGKMGAALTSLATGERAVDPAAEQKYFPIEFRLTKKYHFDKRTIKLDPQRHVKYIAKFGTDEYVERKTATEILEDNGHDPSTMDLKTKAQIMSQITKDFYRELISLADEAGALFPEFRDERVALEDVYIEG